MSPLSFVSTTRRARRLFLATFALGLLFAPTLSAESRKQAFETAVAPGETLFFEAAPGILSSWRLNWDESWKSLRVGSFLVLWSRDSKFPARLVITTFDSDIRSGGIVYGVPVVLPLGSSPSGFEFEIRMEERSFYEIWAGEYSLAYARFGEESGVEVSVDGRGEADDLVPISFSVQSWSLAPAPATRVPDAVGAGVLRPGARPIALPFVSKAELNARLLDAKATREGKSPPVRLRAIAADSPRDISSPRSTIYSRLSFDPRLHAPTIRSGLE
jgi:hypothetical protein